MQLMVSPSCLVVDAQTHPECLARNALFQTADGPYETPDALGSYWHFAESANQRYRRQDTASLTSKAKRG